MNFTLHKGEILGLAGLGGSGRSEVLRTLLGIRDFSGTLSLEGKPWQPKLKNFARALGLHSGRAAVSGLGSEPDRSDKQSPAFHWQLRQILGIASSTKTTTEIRGGLVPCESSRDWHFTENLATEWWKSTESTFARATWNQPKLLLLDEPTRGVDVGAKQEIYSLIRQASQEGTAVLMVSSELGELIGLCDRILVLRDGQIHHELQTNGLREADLLAYCQGVRATEITE